MVASLKHGNRERDTKPNTGVTGGSTNHGAPSWMGNEMNGVLCHLCTHVG